MMNLTYGENLVSLTHIVRFQYLICEKKGPLYIVLEVKLSVGGVVCFRSDSLHMKYYGMNFINVLCFKKLP